jgi:AP-3 complex subunit delta-1
MSQPWFGHKRIGYLGAAQTFNNDTEVVVLTTHQFKKVFTSGVQASMFGAFNSSNASANGMVYEKGCALNCLAAIATQYLSETLMDDVSALLTSSSSYVQKKAVLAMYRMLEKNPVALVDNFERIKSKVTSDDPTVITAAINVFCELARKNPKNYVILAPMCYNILTTSTNNWLLIKTSKLVITSFSLGSSDEVFSQLYELIDEEPRLPNKILAPLLNIISTTPAKSLLFETIKTVIKGLPLVSNKVDQRNALKICVEKLGSFVSDSDPNCE